MAFSENTLNFLFENRVVDSKSWFEEHREQYNQVVLTPLRQLVTDLTPYMLEIDPLLNCEPKVGKCISRIYRDTRFSKDKHMFRDVMWVSFFRRKQLYYGMPGFFFEFSPRHLRWGCGYYQASPESMDALRRLMLEGDPLFRAARRTLERSKELYLEDSAYKRSRYPDAPAELQPWLNQRNICFMADSMDFDMFYSDGLAGELGLRFQEMVPLYRFLMKGEEESTSFRPMP